MEVIEVMSRFAVIERASIDEAYMDLTAAVQQRLKNMTDKQIEPHLLRTTYIQGYPQSFSEQEASAEDIVLDKGGLCPNVYKVITQLIDLALYREGWC